MAVAVGTVTISTGAIGTTFTISGLAFQPTWVALFSSGRATEGSGEADMRWHGGFATSTSSRRAYTSQSDHAVGAAAADHMWRDDCVVATLTTAGAIGGLADLDAFTSDGFRLIVDDVFPAAQVCGWICGDGDVGIVDFTDPAGTGDQDYNVGIDMTAGAADDKFVLFLGAVDAAVNTAQVYSFWTVGFAAGNTPAEAVLAGNSQDAAGTSVTQAYCRSGRSVASVWDDAVRSRASLTTWLSTGFRLNWAEVDAGTTSRFSALAVKNTDMRYAVGDALTSTGTSNQTENTAYEPTGLLIISAARAASSDDATTAHDTRIVGAADGPSNRWCVAAQDKDASGTTDVWIDTRTDAIYSNPSVVATQAVEGLMDIVSFDATPSFTYVMDDADPAQSFFAYLLFADAPGGGAATSFPFKRNPGLFSQLFAR